MRHSKKRLLDLISSIYDAVLDPSLWPAVAEGSMKHLEVRALLFSGVELPRRQVFQILEGVTPEQRRLFSERFSSPQANPVARAAVARPVMELMTTEELIPREALLRSAFYRQVVAPADLHRLFGVNLLRERRVGAALSVFRPERGRPFDGEDRERLQPLLAHFQRAAQLMLRLETLERDRRLDEEILDRLPFGVALVDEQGLVCQQNTAAEEVLRGRDGLRLRRGRLTADHPAAQSRLAELLEEAQLAGGGGGTGSGGVLAVPRRSDQPAYELLIAPLGRVGQPIGARRGVAMVVIRDRSEEGVADPQALQALYGLTPAEAVVARSVAGGSEPAALARSLGVGLTTVRTHLYRALQKMGVRRQAELARLVAGGPLGLRPPRRRRPA